MGHYRRLCFLLLPFSYKWKGEEKIHFPSPPTPSEKLQKNTSIPIRGSAAAGHETPSSLKSLHFKGLWKLHQIDFSHIPSICYFCGFSSSLLHFPGAGEQVYTETWGTLMWFGNQKIKVFERVPNCFSFFHLLTYLRIYFYPGSVEKDLAHGFQTQFSFRP